jgi:hypothetical protein
MGVPAKSRRYDRIGLPKGMPVVWQGTGNRFVSRVAILGLGGLFIEVSEPAATGEVLKLVFQVPNGDVRARAMVRSSYPGKGMGVEFTSMGPEDRARLNQLLTRLLAPTGTRSSDK